MKPSLFDRGGLLQGFFQGNLRYFFACILFVTISTNKGFCQTNVATTTTLPTGAQETVNKGVMAAKLPDYLLAIRYFEEARKLAPQSPEIFSTWA